MKSAIRSSLLHLVPVIVRHRSQSPRKGRRLLLMRPDHIGDVLFTTPAVRLLRSQLPEAHISFLVGPWSKAVLERNHNIDDLIIWDFPWFNRRRKTSIIEPYIALKNLAGHLQHYSFDTVINLRFDFWWGCLASYLAGIPQRVGYDLTDCSPFLTHKFKYVRGRHEVEQNLALVEQFLELTGNRVQFASRELEFAVTDEDERFAAEYLFAKGAREGDQLIALHPGTGSVLKQWETDKFAQLGNALAHRYNCTVIITGSSAEESLAREIAAKLSGRHIVAAGETSLSQLGAIFRHCKVAIGVDSGAMHLAVALGVPTVHLFGPSDDRLFGPYGDGKKHRVVRASLPCSPCGRFDFASSQRIGDCMSAISVQQVMDEVTKVLQE